jgi:hypothetical protein
MTTYNDMAKQAETLKEQGRELEGLVPVKGRVAKDVRAVFSLRLAPAELEEITNAASLQGIKVGDFIRQSALKGAREVTSGTRLAKARDLLSMWAPDRYRPEMTDAEVARLASEMSRELQDLGLAV